MQLKSMADAAKRIHVSLSFAFVVVLSNYSFHQAKLKRAWRILGVSRTVGAQHRVATASEGRLCMPVRFLHYPRSCTLKALAKFQYASVGAKTRSAKRNAAIRNIAKRNTAMQNIALPAPIAQRFLCKTQGVCLKRAKGARAHPKRA